MGTYVRPTDEDLAVLMPTVDVKEALRRLGNDPDLYCQIIEIFIEDVPSLMRTASQAMVDDDAISARIAAHNLRGLAGIIGATRAAAVASQLERFSAAGDLMHAADSLRTLAPVLHDLDEVLREYCRRVTRIPDADDQGRR